MDNSDNTTTPRASAEAIRSDMAERLDRCAELLSKGRTPAQVGETLGVRAGTVRQWLVDYPSLRQAVNAMRAEASEAAYNHLAERSSSMAAVISDAAQGGSVTPLQVKAAETALRIMAQFRDADLEARVAALEAGAKGQEG